MAEKVQIQQNIFVNNAEINLVFASQVENRWKVAKASVFERIDKLKKLEKWIIDNKSSIRAALYQDFKKPATDVDLTEIYSSLSEVRHAIKHLKKWSKPQRVKRTKALLTTKSWISYEPRGVVLIIAPWNYPFLLNVSPLISAISAGNCAIIKPSELAANTSHLITKMVNELFPDNEVAVFEGKKEVAIELLKKPFDHIFFTGSTAIGKRVMEAASKNLSSVTLELGGKSPVIVDNTADIKDAAAKIAWSKFMNCGQTCIAPDYLLVQKDIVQELLSELKIAINKYYGESSPDKFNSADYARIINKDHFQRLKQLLDDAEKSGAVIEIGGELNEFENYIPPTVLSNVNLDSQIMIEEIFGPLLPIITYNSLDEAINLINIKPKPLSLYLFSNEKTVVENVLSSTSSGGVCINDTVIHFSQFNLPFGGVNTSGMGRSHGFHGFKTFSNEKAVVKHHRFSPLKLLYPPYTKRVQKLVDLLLKYL